MTTIWYNDIENVLISLTDPNTWGATYEVPWVSSPKINGSTSIYNVEASGTGIAGWSTSVSWWASDHNTVNWWNGSIYLPDWTELTVTAWNTGNMSTTTYIYYDREDDTVKTTTSASSSVWEKKILLCVASPTTTWKNAEFQAFWTNKQSVFIRADNIAANTITANEIASNTITASEIQSYSITASKLDVDYLSAISADLGSITAWDITGTTITAWSTSSAGIKLYPSWTTWYLDFYYGWSRVARLQWQYVSWVGNTMGISWSNIALDWDVYCLGKLKIPVWTDLY